VDPCTRDLIRYVSARRSPAVAVATVAVIDALAAAIREATAPNDITAARIAHDAPGKLLAAEESEGARVVDLSTRRKGGT
jgi:hypothetical protein